ncbi:hypothetical protein KI387_029241, partial [Taxus chinensis]
QKSRAEIDGKLTSIQSISSFLLDLNSEPKCKKSSVCKMEYFSSEALAKQQHDRKILPETETNGAIIVGAGPSGMAVSACLTSAGVNCVVIEREECLASLWKHKTYSRLKLHIGKDFCSLPLMSFPKDYPNFVTKDQFLEYLEEYAAKFDIRPHFCEAVESANFCQEMEKWRVVARFREDQSEKIYFGRFLIVATGENSEVFVPRFEGIESFTGRVLHSKDYKTGMDFRGDDVLVVGCGNSGMEIALDLVNYEARPSIAIRSRSHVLPREIFGRSTFSVAMYLLKLLPIRIVDNMLILYSNLTMGDTSSCGISRPAIGPLELKNTTGKSPALDIGAIAKIRSGHIKVFPNIKRIIDSKIEFEDGEVKDFRTIIFCTGYRSNVLSWLK